MINCAEGESCSKQAVPLAQLTNSEEEMWNNIWSPLRWMLVHHFVVFHVDAGRVVADKILTRENIYACVFIYTRQASVVKEVLWTDSLRCRIMFTQLGSVLFLIRSPYGAYARSHWTLLQSTANLHSVARGSPADKWLGGEVQGESCQNQSALYCCCSNLRKCGGDGGVVRDREWERGDVHKVNP